MTQRVAGITLAIALLAGITPGWCQQYYLYAPHAVAAEEKAKNNDGVLVQEVSVKKGDTLYGLSRTFNGHGTYFPQILLFNDIKDPNLIYPGNVLRIPVSRNGAAQPALDHQVHQLLPVVPSVDPVSASTAGEPKKGAAAEEKKREVRRSKAAVPAATPAKSAKQPTAATAAASEQKLYERAIKSYRQEDYRTALEQFDRFLADYPSSALAADASLYKAECYLKQSNQ